MAAATVVVMIGGDGLGFFFFFFFKETKIRKMLKIIFEFNGCIYDKFLFVEYKAEQKIWEGRFGFHNLPLLP